MPPAFRAAATYGFRLGQTPTTAGPSPLKKHVRLAVGSNSQMIKA